MQAHLNAAGEAAAVHAAVHVVAMQRIKAHAAAGRCQLAHLPHQAIHRLLHSAQRACCIIALHMNASERGAHQSRLKSCAGRHSI